MDPKEFRRSLRKNQTGAEARLWSVLRNRKLEGRKFRRQHTFGKYVVDFFCFEENLVIEADGSSHDNIGSIIYDEKRELYLKEQGLRVIRFRNKEIFHQLEAVLEEIKQNFNSNGNI